MFKKGQLVRGNKSGTLFYVLRANYQSARVRVLSGKYVGALTRLEQFNIRKFTLIGNNYKARG